MKWKRTIILFVEGDPKAQPRPKAFSRGGHVGIYTPKAANAWKNNIIQTAKLYLPESPIKDPVFVDVRYYMKRPARLMRKKDPESHIPHTSKPDIDNLNKAVFDALTNSGVLVDDCKIFQISARKYYHSKKGKPGAMIVIKSFKVDEIDTFSATCENCGAKVSNREQMAIHAGECVGNNNDFVENSSSLHSRQNPA